MDDNTALDGRGNVISALEELHAELLAGADWENDRLDRFLEALSAVLESIEYSYSFKGVPVPQNAWVIMADAIRGARYYE